MNKDHDLEHETMEVEAVYQAGHYWHPTCLGKAITSKRGVSRKARDLAWQGGGRHTRPVPVKQAAGVCPQCGHCVRPPLWSL